MERYERLKILGVGSFGKVYLMRHRDERRLVCAKIIRIKNLPRKEREACRTEVGCKAHIALHSSSRSKSKLVVDKCGACRVLSMRGMLIDLCSSI